MAAKGAGKNKKEVFAALLKILDTPDNQNRPSDALYPYQAACKQMERWKSGKKNRQRRDFYFFPEKVKVAQIKLYWCLLIGFWGQGFQKC